MDAFPKGVRDMTNETPRPGPTPNPAHDPVHEQFLDSLLNFPAEVTEQPPCSYRGGGNAGDDQDEGGEEEEDPAEDPTGNKLLRT